MLRARVVISQVEAGPAPGQVTVRLGGMPVVGMAVIVYPTAEERRALYVGAEFDLAIEGFPEGSFRPSKGGSGA